MADLNVSVLVSMVDKMSGPLKGLSGQMQSLRTTGLALSAGGAAVTGTLFAMTKAAAKVGSDLSDVADRTGVSVEALSELQWAAGQTGTDLNGVETALKRLSRNAYDAQRGLVTSQEAFQRLGISAVDANGQLRPTEVLFNEAGAALAKMENETERSALALTLMGRSGTALLPMMLDTRGGIEGLREKARELGLTLSTDAALALDKFDDDLNTAHDTVGMLATQIGAAALPAMQSLLDIVLKATASYLNWTKAHPTLNKAVLGITFALGSLAAVFGPLLLALSQAVLAWDKLSTAQLNNARAARTAAGANAQAGTAAAAGGAGAAAAGGGAGAQAGAASYGTRVGGALGKGGLYAAAGAVELARSSVAAKQKSPWAGLGMAALMGGPVTMAAAGAQRLYGQITNHFHGPVNEKQVQQIVTDSLRQAGAGG